MDAETGPVGPSASRRSSSSGPCTIAGGQHQRNKTVHFLWKTVHSPLTYKSTPLHVYAHGCMSLMNVFASVSIHCMPLCASLYLFFSGTGTAHSKKNKKTSKIGGAGSGDMLPDFFEKTRLKKYANGRCHNPSSSSHISDHRHMMMRCFQLSAVFVCMCFHTSCFVNNMFWLSLLLPHFLIFFL